MAVRTKYTFGIERTNQIGTIYRYVVVEDLHNNTPQVIGNYEWDDMQGTIIRKYEAFIFNGTIIELEDGINNDPTKKIVEPFTIVGSPDNE